ncbi:hypothetical protein [Roseimaritima sediminicola]|uniref:hypothetical protein n=1 Tax=Roseimaritima sediminicola TaxID=2662066 RepID=UPI0012984777|nr:hypothetical protein [Roseimaritima sediminicola]
MRPARFSRWPQSWLPRHGIQLQIGSLQYPHMIEHDEHLWIALSRCKLQTEMFRVSLDALDEVLE